MVMMEMNLAAVCDDNDYDNDDDNDDDDTGEVDGAAA